MFCFPQYNVQQWPPKRDERDLIKTVNGNKLCSSIVIQPAKLHPMTNALQNKEDLYLYFGEFSHAGSDLVGPDANIPQFHKRELKNCTGKAKTHGWKKVSAQNQGD